MSVFIESHTEMTIALLSLLLSLVAIWISTRSVRFTKRQTELMENQEARTKRGDAIVAEWGPKFHEAVRAVLTVWPKFIVSSSPSGPAYPRVFPDSDLRLRIETYLIDADLGRHRANARPVADELLRRPTVQETISQVLDSVKQFKEKDPGSASKMGL